MSQIMARIPKDIAFCYEHDICIISKTKKEHIQNIRKVFNEPKNGNLKLNKEKCLFLLEQVTYLGHLIRNPEQASQL